MDMQTDLFSEVDNGAAFSDCRKYRYALWRIWDKSKPLVMFIGLNPSKANETETDRTISTVKDFASRWGFGGVYMMNCFPYVSTDPDELKTDDGHNLVNDKMIIDISQKCEEVIFAWGNFKIAQRKGNWLQGIFPDAKCLVKNKNGSPHHPLYLSLNTKPINFNHTPLQGGK